MLREHLYKEPVNGHLSKEVVQLSDNFNYNQLVRTIKEEIDKYDKYMFWKDGYKGVPEDIANVIKENNQMLYVILDHLGHLEKNKVTNTSQYITGSEVGTAYEASLISSSISKSFCRPSQKFAEFPKYCESLSAVPAVMLLLPLIISDILV